MAFKEGANRRYRHEEILFIDSGSGGLFIYRRWRPQNCSLVYGSKDQGKGYA
jgi:hypothetical protein